GRTGINVIGLTREVKQALSNNTEPLKVAVMGCVVNGPGEAREADFGIAGGKGRGIVFAHGRVVKTCDESELVASLLQEIEESSRLSRRTGPRRARQRAAVFGPP
ncbi:flavodoxin-dependent (E)-4-hydroxy-3-methylbut-2-enyl-diphosphate synthase, partial [candidate division WOR-3 bacterium]|nr:flavodoxin-dependent (E)-4-hydroxy-3-methylbut-2-enyl-diphosphate synthase [candidate division WOR-3 bacterium]